MYRRKTIGFADSIYAFEIVLLSPFVSYLLCGDIKSLWFCLMMLSIVAVIKVCALSV